MIVDNVGHIVTLTSVVANLGCLSYVTGMSVLVVRNICLQLQHCPSVVSDKSLCTYGNGLVRGLQLIRLTIIAALTLPSQWSICDLNQCENHTRIPSTCPIILTLRPWIPMCLCTSNLVHVRDRGPSVHSFDKHVSPWGRRRWSESLFAKWINSV